MQKKQIEKLYVSISHWFLLCNNNYFLEKKKKLENLQQNKKKLFKSIIMITTDDDPYMIIVEKKQTNNVNFNCLFLVLWRKNEIKYFIYFIFLPVLMFIVAKYTQYGFYFVWSIVFHKIWCDDVIIIIIIGPKCVYFWMCREIIKKFTHFFHFVTKFHNLKYENQMILARINIFWKENKNLANSIGKTKKGQRLIGINRSIFFLIN